MKKETIRKIIELQGERYNNVVYALILHKLDKIERELLLTRLTASNEAFKKGIENVLLKAEVIHEILLIEGANSYSSAELERMNLSQLNAYFKVVMANPVKETNSEKDNIIAEIIELEGKRSFGERNNLRDLNTKDVSALERIVLDLLVLEQKKNSDIDLFDFIHLFPSLNELVESYNEDEDPYKENERLLSEFSKLGFIFEYGLCGTPFNLRKLN